MLMQTRSSIQHNTSNEANPLAMTIKPRPWGEPGQHPAQAAQAQTARYDISKIDLFSHDPGPRPVPNVRDARRPMADSRHQQSQSAPPQPIGRGSALIDLFSHDPGPRPVPSLLQAKLTVGTPNDVYEQEADRVADQVMSMPEPASQLPVQRKLDPLIQSEPKPEESEEPKVDFNALPPEFKASWGQFNFSADTGTAKLGYQPGKLNLGLGYNYGDNIFADAKYKNFSTQFGLNPSSGDFSVGGSYKYNNLNFGANYNTNGNFGASLGYGNPLLPMPHSLSKTVVGGEKGLHGIVDGLPGAG
jgi:hypothetical protein